MSYGRKVSSASSLASMGTSAAICPMSGISTPSDSALGNELENLATLPVTVAGVPITFCILKPHCRHHFPSSTDVPSHSACSVSHRSCSDSLRISFDLLGWSACSRPAPEVPVECGRWTDPPGWPGRSRGRRG